MEDKICKKEECTGCYSCYNICPKKAIKMVEDEYGNIYPYIDKKLCVNCGLCAKRCPSKNSIKFEIPKEVYGMHSRDSTIRKNSTSGGAATIFSIKIIEQGGIVYGANNIDNNGEFSFLRVDNVNDLSKLKGSKYIHCYVKEIYISIKSDLESGKKVLFIATPCQIAGLKSFLNKEYENLYLVDLVCHGVPSQKLFKDDIEFNNIDINNINRISFRDEDGFKLKLYNNNKILLNIDMLKDYYYKYFFEGKIYRENCYSCKYARKERISDITIGDFWGLDKNSKLYENGNLGVSLILINTSKGRGLFYECKDLMVVEKRTLQEAVNGNKQLNNPTNKTKAYKIYKKNYPKYGYIRTMKRMRNYKDRLKNNKIIYRVYKLFKENRHE